jgi:hypothetical protein
VLQISGFSFTDALSFSGDVMRNIRVVEEWLYAPEVQMIITVYPLQVQAITSKVLQKRLQAD